MRVRPGVFAGAALAFTITLTGLPAQAAQAAVAKPAVSSEVLSKLAEDGTTSFWVYLRDRADLTAAARIADSGDRTTRVYEQLTETAADSQRGLKSLLDGKKASYRSYWIPPRAARSPGPPARSPTRAPAARSPT